MSGDGADLVTGCECRQRISRRRGGGTGIKAERGYRNNIANECIFVAVAVIDTGGERRRVGRNRGWPPRGAVGSVERDEPVSNR
jgi:hypothetical protein